MLSPVFCIEHGGPRESLPLASHVSPDLSVVHATKSGGNIAGSSGIKRQPISAWKEAAETSAAQGKYEIFGRNGNCLQRTKGFFLQSCIASVVFDQTRAPHGFVAAVLVGCVSMQNAVGDGLWFSARR
jgi:hypothetical protein